jgi:hypothetical protein
MSIDLDTWCRATSPVASGHQVILQGLSSHVQAEILCGLEQRCQRGVITYLYQRHCQVEQSDQDLRRCVLVNPQVICDA